MHRYSIQCDEVAAGVRMGRAKTARPSSSTAAFSASASARNWDCRSPFDMRFSNPIDLHAVALRYPERPHHRAAFRRRLFSGSADAGRPLPQRLSGYVQLQSLDAVSGIAHLDLRHVFRRALDVVGPKRLLFGTDSSFFPRGWHHQIFDEQATALYEIGVSEADARSIFGENLLRIIGR